MNITFGDSELRQIILRKVLRFVRVKILGRKELLKGSPFIQVGRAVQLATDAGIFREGDTQKWGGESQSLDTSGV